MTDYIICYDIACPRRLARIHRHLKKHAWPLQYSVFLFAGTSHQMQHCLLQLQKLMDPRHDDIRAYPLPERGLRLCIGRHTLPEGIHWSGLAEPWQNGDDHASQTPDHADATPTMPGDEAPPYLIV